MKTHQYSLRIAICTVSLLLISSTVSAEFMLTTGVRFNGVRDDLMAETKGAEIIVPVGFFYTQKNFSVSLQTGYANARVTPPEGGDATLASVTDTLLSVNYTIPDLPVILSGGISVNLPTGKEQLTRTEQQAILGESSDLFDIEKFGEGLNVGLNLSVMKQFDKIAFGLNGLYVYKGEYDPTEAVENDDLDPGDQFLVAGLTIFKASPSVMLTALVTYSYFLKDQVNGRESFQEGQTFTVGGALNYTGKPLAFSLSVMGMLPQKDQELVGGKLQAEPDNSAQNSLTTALNVSYAYSPSLTFELVGDMRYYTESDRVNPGNGLPYAGKRVRYSIGPGLRVAFNQKFSCSLLVKYVLLNEEQDIYLATDRTFDGIYVNAGFAYAL